MIESGEARSKRSTRDVILNETVNVDNGGCVAELNTGNKHEDESDHGIHGFQHLCISGFLRSHSSGNGELWE